MSGHWGEQSLRCWCFWYTVFAFTERLKEPFGPGLSSMSKINLSNGRKVNVELQYNAHACCVLLTFAIASKRLVCHIVVDCRMKYLKTWSCSSQVKFKKIIITYLQLILKGYTYILHYFQCDFILYIYKAYIKTFQPQRMRKHWQFWQFFL